MEQLQQIQGLQERLMVDTSEGKPVYLIAVGDKPTYVRLSHTSYYLLQQLSTGISFESLSHNLHQQGQKISPTELETAYQKVIEKVTEIEKNPQLGKSSFFFRFPLFPKSIVVKIASLLSVAFHKSVAYCLLAFIGFSLAIAFHNGLAIKTNLTEFWWAYLLFFISILFHELGHASACKRYGANPSEIGFTVYMIWPALYSDVSTAWQLKRWQRVMVDVGGVFFQLIIASVYIWAYAYTSWNPLKLALVMILGSCVFTLNPIFKFDGYWVVADALGITNLSLQPTKIFSHFIAKLRKKTVKPLPWSPWIIVFLSIYTIFSFAIWGYFLWIILPLFWTSLLKYPDLISNLIPNLFQWPPILIKAQIQTFLGSTFIVVIGTLMLLNLAKKIPFKKSKKNLEK